MADCNNRIELIPSVSLRRDNTISDAFRGINGRFGIVVTVLGEGNRLSGIVSEGDLRRAILGGNSLETPLENVMNKNPIVLKLGELDNESKHNEAIRDIYRRYETEQVHQATIPVIDDNRLVVGLVMPEMLETSRLRGSVKEGTRAEKPHVLVVGGAGYIGSVFVRMLLDEGWRVRVLDNMLYMQTSLDRFSDERLSVMKGDVANINDVVEAIEGIDAVVYLAEIVGDAACAYRPGRALKTNYLSVTNMAHLSAHLNINRFIYASSCSVYGGSRAADKYLSEESELNPVSHYGRMKIMAEQALMGIPNPLFAPTILRLATVFGYSYRPRFDLVVNTFAKNAFFKGHIEVAGGNQWRPNVHVYDVARAIVKTLEAPIDRVSRQTFNVGSMSENYTINCLAELTGRVFSGVKTKHTGGAADLRNYRINSDKIEKKLGFSAGISVLEGLKRLKSVFQKGEIESPDALRYSNIEALKERGV
jgi:nucleoside-diphosphate-sugar epimerase